MPDLPDDLTVRPVAEFTPAQSAAAMERCFEGYIVPVRVTAESWERRFRSEHLDPFASRVYERDGRTAAVLFITRRGWTSRVGGMGVAKEFRGTGLGRRVMTDAIAQARARGDHALLLEVIEQNTPAVNLYASLGFRSMRRLVGWRLETPQAGGAPDALQEIDPLELSRVVQREGDADLPWQMAPQTLAAATAPARAFSLDGRAFALVANPQAETLTLTSLVVPRAERRRGWGTRILQAIAMAFPYRAFTVTSILPQDTAEDWFVRTGWVRQAITQIEMRLDL